jgi:DNA-binding transcriptional ArsR family regulator
MAEVATQVGREGIVNNASRLRELQLFHRSLSDANRLRILRILATEGDRTVSELQRQVHISQPLMTWHLHRLKRAGIVTMARAGREVHCSFDRERFSELQDRTFRVLANTSEDLR